MRQIIRKRICVALALGLIALVLSTQGIRCADTTVEPIKTADIFQERYNAWLIARDAWWKDHSSYSDRPMLPEDDALTEMGPSAIPFWIAMFEDQLRNRTWDNIMLTESIGAFHSLVWKRFDESEYPTGKYANQNITMQLYIDWWKCGRVDTPEKFIKLFDKWDSFDRMNVKTKANKVANKILNMGVEIMPLVMEKIELGDVRLVPWVKRIMRTSVPWKTADLVTVKDWWEKNKEKLTFPEFQPEKPTPIVTPAK